MPWLVPAILCSKALGATSAPFTALQAAEVTLLPDMQPEMVPANFGAQYHLLTAHLIDATCITPPDRPIAPASNLAPETMLA